MVKIHFSKKNWPIKVQKKFIQAQDVILFRVFRNGLSLKGYFHFIVFFFTFFWLMYWNCMSIFVDILSQK